MTDTVLIDLQTGDRQDSPVSQLSEEWAAQLEQVMEGDREFFLQHPERDYYVRPITPVEVVEGQQLGKAVTTDAFVLVGEIAPGSRVRLTILDGGPPPVEEFKRIQKQVRREMGVKSLGFKERLKQSNKSRSRAKGFG
jgi:hypothetical protein